MRFTQSQVIKKNDQLISDDEDGDNPFGVFVEDVDDNYNSDLVYDPLVNSKVRSSEPIKMAKFKKMTPKGSFVQ